MEWVIKGRVLHGIYESKEDLPKEILHLATLYEGAIPKRVGWNIPFSFLKQQEDTYSKVLLKTYGKDAEYLVIYQKKDIQTKRHELLHAKYAMDQIYRNQVNALWESLTSYDKDRIRRILCKLHYPDDPSIQLDEFQAYYYTERPSFFGLRRDHTTKIKEIKEKKRNKK